MRRLVLLLCTVTALSACERRKGPQGKVADDWGGGGDPSNPHAQVGPSEMGGLGGGDPSDPHAGVDMGGGDPSDPHAGVDMGGGMAPPDDREIDPNKYLRGKIVLTDATEGKVPAGAVIFLFAKSKDGGPPLAVERLDVGAFP